MSLAWFIALRYSRAKRRNRLVSFITFISIIAIALGVTVLVTVMSVMNGFERELRKGILSVTPHISMTAYRNEDVNLTQIAEVLRRNDDIVTVAPFINGPAMIGRGKGTALELHGVIPQQQVELISIGDHMVEGRFIDLNPGNIVIGKILADKLGIQAGDVLSIFTSQGTFQNPNILPKIRRYHVIGIFSVGVYQYDERIAFIHINDAKEQLLGASGAGGLQIKTRDPFTAPGLAARLRTAYEDNFFVSDWTRRHFNLFRAVQQQKGMMFIILTLIVAVAAFSIVTALIMAVTDKSAEIAILRTLGAKPGLIMRIFILQGVLIGVVGTLFGLGSGILLSDNIGSIISWLESILGIHLLPGEVYFISHLAGEKHWADIGLVALTAFLISLTATVYPSWRAANTKPASALKYE